MSDREDREFRIQVGNIIHPTCIDDASTLDPLFGQMNIDLLLTTITAAAFTN